MWKADFFSSSGQNVPKEPACICTCAFSISRRAGGLGMAESNGQCLVHIVCVVLSWIRALLDCIWDFSRFSPTCKARRIFWGFNKLGSQRKFLTRCSHSPLALQTQMVRKSELAAGRAQSLIFKTGVWSMGKWLKTLPTTLILTCNRYTFYYFVSCEWLKKQAFVHTE